jgi:hypothetical protein
VIDNYGNQVIPGSLDNGATDTEYTVHPERIICAAEEQFATHAELDAAVSDVCDVQDELEARIVALEAKVAWLHSQVRPELPEPESEMPSDLTVAYMKGYADGKAEVVRTEGDYAHIPAAKWKFICDELETLRAKDKTLSALTQTLAAELETLRAKWDAVPWKDIATVLRDAADSFAWDGVDEWYVTNAPEGAAE